ncbi:MAG: hypothetical protein CM15mP103_07000 [Gammaproteobacteria bacterium]|nr:MAG: hypothetical protein CM15mP103_07000 [Gammaproteobacteria bacterium]
MKIDKQTPAARAHTTRRGTVEYRIDDPNFPGGIWGESTSRLHAMPTAIACCARSVS